MPEDMEEKELEEPLEEEEEYEGEEEPEEEEILEEEYDAEPEEIGDEEDPDIPIVYDRDGEEVQYKLKYSQLTERLKAYDEAAEQLKKYDEYVQAVYPIIETVRQSNLLQQILYYKAQGFTDEQIKEGLAKLTSQEQPQKEYQSYEEELKDSLLSEIEKRIKPLEAKATQIETEKMLREVSEHNNQLFKEVLAKEGMGELSQEDIKKIGNYLAQIYPNTDLRFLKLTKPAVEALISLVKKEKVKIKGTPSISKLPKKIQSVGKKPTSGLSEAKQPKTLEDRIRLKKQLFG
jgi:small-conductance mechanosensitive channel